jgi:signal transduction histidine kinase
VKSIPSESPKPPADPLPGSVHDRTPFSMPELRIAVTYVLLASIWIIGSDTILSLFVDGRDDTVFFQSFKGLNFVITTGVVLFFVLRRAYGGWRCSEERRMATLQSARESYRKLSSKLQTMREEERTSISREIHDELGQQLTGIKMQLRLIEDHLADREDRSLNPLIDDLVETSAMIDETIHSVRRISSGLRPLALDHLGLAAALDEEAEQFSKRTGIECRLKIGEMEEPIQPGVQTAAFRIFQEALTNVARHAEARVIDAECSTRDGVLKLTVRDDGVGIAPDAAGNTESLGLMGMLERAADVGG